MIYLRPSRKIDDRTAGGQGGAIPDMSLVDRFITDSHGFRFRIESSNGTKLGKETTRTQLTARLFSSDGKDITEILAAKKPSWHKRVGKNETKLGEGWSMPITQEMLAWHTYITVSLEKSSILLGLAEAEGKSYPIAFRLERISAEIELVSELPIYRDILNVDKISLPVKALLASDPSFISATKASPFAFNLVKGGGKPFHRALDANSHYKVHTWLMDEQSLSGEWYTLVVKVKFVPKEAGKSWVSFYLGGSSEFWDAGQESGHKRTSARDGVFVFHRRVSVASNELAIYQGGNGWGANPVEHRGCEIQVDWVAMYKGKHDNPPLEFVPHRSEIKGDAGKSVTVAEIKPALISDLKPLLAAELKSPVIAGLKSDAAFVAASKGAKGDAGATGAKGADGISPSAISVAKEFAKSPECKAEVGKQLAPTIGKVNTLEGWTSSKEAELTEFVGALSKSSVEIATVSEDTWGGKAIMQLKRAKAKTEPLWHTAMDGNFSEELVLPPAAGYEFGKTLIFDFTSRSSCSQGYGYVVHNADEPVIDTLRRTVHHRTFKYGIYSYHVLLAPQVEACSKGAFFEFRVVKYCDPNSGNCRKAWLWVNYVDLEQSSTLERHATRFSTLDGKIDDKGSEISRLEKKVAALPTQSNVVGFNASHWGASAGWELLSVVDGPLWYMKGTYTAKKTDGFLFVREYGGAKTYTITLPNDAAIGTVIQIRTAAEISCKIQGAAGANLQGRQSLGADELCTCVCSGANGSEWVITIMKAIP